MDSLIYKLNLFVMGVVDVLVLLELFVFKL